MGATSNNPRTKADKLYSPHLPFVHFNEQWIKAYRSAGFCGPRSDVYLIKESYLDKAMEIAESQGVNCEYSGIAGLALMLQTKQMLPKNSKMLIVNTGKTKYP
jgi:threonine synthase